MSRKVLVRASIACLVFSVLLGSALALIVIFAWCAGKRMFRDDEKRIREVIEEMRLGAEELSADVVIKHFSKDYSDNNGSTKMMIFGLIRISRVVSSRIIPRLVKARLIKGILLSRGTPFSRSI